jgi:hypothetical protein
MSLSMIVLIDGTVRKLDCSVSPLPCGVVTLTARDASGVEPILSLRLRTGGGCILNVNNNKKIME